MNPSGTAAAQAKTREWPSFYGEPVPMRGDPFQVGQDFIRALHHRLCQPLTTLSCTLELMQMGRDTDPKLTEQLQTAMAQAEEVVDVMGRFRQLFEAEAPQVGTHLVPIDSVVNEVVEDIRPLAKMGNLTLTLTGRGGLVRIDHGVLRQVLWNVLQNCIELTSAGGAVGANVNGSCVVITDTSGLDTDEMANIFDPFSFCQNPEDKIKVSNLPLALAQRLIGASGGSLTVQRAKSSIGREFQAKLPTAL
jgi:signal transduction histidine kinase